MSVSVVSVANVANAHRLAVSVAAGGVVLACAWLCVPVFERLANMPVCI